MSTLTVQNIQGSASSSNTINVASGHKISGNVTHGTGSVFPAGHVIQVVQSTNGSSSTTTSTSYVNTPLNVSITPTSTSSKIHISFNFAVGFMAQNDHGYMTVYRDSTNLNPATAGGANDGFFLLGNSGADAPYQYICRYMNFSYLDSPSTTSSITYHLAMKMNSGGAGIAIATEIAG